MKNYVA